jgi:hypothetical protein
LYKEGVTKEWQDKYGIEYMVLFQDTNGLAFHTLPLMLGVSVKHNFIMNSLCVPRKAKQAIGGVAKLKHRPTGQERYARLKKTLLVFSAVCLYTHDVVVVVVVMKKKISPHHNRFWGGK